VTSHGLHHAKVGLDKHGLQKVTGGEDVMMPKISGVADVMMPKIS
jgi:hypothetical protein